MKGKYNKEYYAIYRAANRESIRESNRAYYQRNKDKIKIHKAKYREENKEKRKLLHHAYYLANKEKIKAYWKENSQRMKEHQEKYRRENREEINKRIAEWGKANPEKRKTAKANRASRISGNGGLLSHDIVSRLFDFQKGGCVACRNKFIKNGYHLDHIIPISKGGENSDRNVQLLCPPCNLKKGAKDPIRFMQEMGLLL